MPSREFQVEVGPLRIVVLGTSFTVTRVGNSVTVDVHRGHVRIDGDAQPLHLYGGQSAEFTVAVPANEPATPALPPSESTDAESHAHADRRDANQRDSSPQPVAEVRLSLDDVLGAADEARLRGDNEQALQLLDDGLRAHPSDPLRQVALFTRARILGDALQRPHEAALGYAEARAAAPHGSLAEDALAREIEALHAAGDLETMQTRRTEYLELFPLGVHRRAVERF